MDHEEKNVKKINVVKNFFTSIITAGIGKLQFVVWSSVSEIDEAGQTKRPFDSRHLIFASKDTNYVRSKAEARLHTGDKYYKQNTAATGASHMVALRIARAMKLQTTAEDLPMPATNNSACSDRRGICYTTECSFLM